MTIAIPRKIILWASTSVFCLMTAVSFAGPPSGDKTTMNDVRQEMKDAAKAIRNYSIDQRDEAAMRAKTMLDKLDAHIERLENQLDKKTDHMDQAARQKAKATLKALRKKRNNLAEWYGGMQHSSEKAWQDVKTGFLKSYQSMQEAFNKAQQNF